MTQMKDRPELPQRRGPRPAPDERLDPVDTPTPTLRAASSAPSVPSKPVARKKREATIAIGPRISVSVMEILDKAVEDEGITQRQALEEAIISRWGNQ